MKASKLVKKALLCFPTQSPRPSRFCISTDTSYISARRTHRCMILHPAQYLGVADILTKRQNILSTVEKWQTESDTICCVEELLLWRRANTQKKHVQEPSNTWQTVHYTAGLLSTFHKWSVGKHPNQLPILLVPLPQMSPEDRKTSLQYIAYNNATEL